MKTALRIAAALVLLLALGFALGPRASVGSDPEPRVVPEDLEGWVTGSEAAWPDLVPGAEKRILWDGAAGERTSLSVVYLHGFSATRQEISPVCERVARQLEANLFMTRLTGHGRGGAAMAEASVAAWLGDAEEALEVGRRLGERVVLVGTSTGATLATWLAVHHPEDLAAVVTISPNFGPRDKASALLLWPWGEQLARLIIGEEYTWTPASPAQAQFWTTSYPSRALLPMMALVEQVNALDLSRLTTPSLVFYSPDDRVIDPALVEARYQALGAYHKVIVPVTAGGGPSHHVIAGDIMGAENTDEVVSRIVGFVRGSR